MRTHQQRQPTLIQRRLCRVWCGLVPCGLHQEGERVDCRRDEARDGAVGLKLQ